LASFERPPVSYLRAVRKVEQTNEIARFLASASLASEECFGGNAVQVVSPRSIIEQVETDVRSVNQRQSPLYPTFRADRLWATLFERRALASEDVNDLIADAYARMTKSRLPGGKPKHTFYNRSVPSTRPNPLRDKMRTAQIDTGLAPGLIIAPTSEVVKTDYQKISGLRFYAVKIDPDSREAKAILAISKVIKEDAEAAKAVMPLFDPVNKFEPDGDPLEVPFMFSPPEEVRDHEEFLARINSLKTPSLPIGEFNWIPSTGTVSDDELV
jgi:hypothetical protein